MSHTAQDCPQKHTADVAYTQPGDAFHLWNCRVTCAWHEIVVIMTFWMLVMQVLAAKQAAAKTAKAAVSKADKRLKQLQTQAWGFL